MLAFDIFRGDIIIPFANRRKKSCGTKRKSFVDKSCLTRCPKREGSQKALEYEGKPAEITFAVTKTCQQ